MAMEGKCEDCGAPTKIRRDGTPFPKCYRCNENVAFDKKQEKKFVEQDNLPPRSAQEQIADLGTTFQMSVGQAYSAFEELEELLEKAYGVKATVPIEFKVARIWEAAMHLNEQYWKNDRTPR